MALQTTLWMQKKSDLSLNILKKLCFLVGVCGTIFFQLEAKVPDLHIVTYTNKPHIGLNYLVGSCEENGIDLHILGIGSADYQGPPLPFPNLFEKVRVVFQALDEGNFPDDDVVMCVDAYDLLILADKEVLLERFLQFDSPIVMGAERECLPVRRLACAYPPSPTSFRYLNAGCYLGYVKDVREMLAWTLLHPKTGGKARIDQASFAIYFLRNPEKLALDYYNLIVLNGYKILDEEIELDLNRKKIIWKDTSIEPCAFHGDVDKRLYKKIRELFYPQRTQERK